MSSLYRPHTYLILLALMLPFAHLYALSDSICEAPLRYEVIKNTDSTDGFFWAAGDRKFNAFLNGSDFILEWKKKKEFWLMRGIYFANAAANEMFIDSIYFKNLSESREDEMVVIYSLFNLRPDGSSHKSKHILVMDPSEKKVILNIELYDYKFGKDENGKIIDFVYEGDIQLSHNSIIVSTSDDSDIDTPSIQLDDGVYFRKGHCFVSK
jgi:hypothetical protein